MVYSSVQSMFVIELRVKIFFDTQNTFLGAC